MLAFAQCQTGQPDDGEMVEFCFLRRLESCMTADDGAVLVHDDWLGNTKLRVIFNEQRNLTRRMLLGVAWVRS